MYIEICDNLAGPGCDLDDWNTIYIGCKCNYRNNRTNELNELLNDTDTKNILNNTAKTTHNEKIINNKQCNIKNSKKNYEYESKINYDNNNISEHESSNIKTISNENTNFNNKYCTNEIDLYNSDKDLNGKCTCISASNGRNYDKNGILIGDFKNDPNWFENIFPINECNLECECDENSCLNRVVQNGCKFKLEIFNCGLKGKGLRTLNKIPIGSFVIEYLGEIIDLKNAENLIELRRSNSEANYIMFLCEHFGKSDSSNVTIIDAKNYSNQARFINHSCEPNLFILPVRINNIVPHAALFALRDINEMEELSYDYNGKFGEATKAIIEEADISSRVLSSKEENISLIKCYCGSMKCKGYLPMNSI